MLKHLLIHFSLHYLSSGHLREVKNKGKFQRFSSKSGVVTVTYERWLLTRGSKYMYSDLTGKLWYVGKLAAEERWSLTRGGRSQRFDCISRPCILKSEISPCVTMLSVSFLVGEQVDRALHLSLAALLGNDIYNFGELVGQQWLNLTFSFKPICDFYAFHSTLLHKLHVYVSRGLCFTMTHTACTE